MKKARSQIPSFKLNPFRHPNGGNEHDAPPSKLPITHNKISSLIARNKKKLLTFRMRDADFTRKRCLTIEHTIGLILSMTASRNANGYDISSQNYFRALGAELGEKIYPAKRNAVSEARGKLSWEAFEYLHGEVNLEREGLPKDFRFKGLVTRAWDGSSFYTPRTDDLLEHFSVRKTGSEEGETHYPYGLLVTAINVFTGQPARAVVGDYCMSERELAKQMLSGFVHGDLALLDRGLGGRKVYMEFEKHGQYFIHRVKTSGDRVATYVREFLAGGRRQKTIKLEVRDEDGEEHTIALRLILGPMDSEGKRIVFATNLPDDKCYKRKAIIKLYRSRWAVETMYGRMKNLLCLEKFHAQTYNGVMQEIYANLLVLSLAAATVAAVVDHDGVDTGVELPNFKNAVECIRRHLFSVIDHEIRGVKPKRLLKMILEEVSAIMYPIRPGRRYARVSMQPIKKWNLKKAKKIREFEASVA